MARGVGACLLLRDRKIAAVVSDSRRLGKVITACIACLAIAKHGLLLARRQTEYAGEREEGAKTDVGFGMSVHLAFSFVE